MGRARQIRLDTRLFARASDGTKFFSAMLHKYAVGDIVAGEDNHDLAALLKRHDEKDEKIGIGICHFEVGDAPDGYGGNVFGS